MEISYKQAGSLPYKYRRSASSNVQRSITSNVGRNVFERVSSLPVRYKWLCKAVYLQQPASEYPRQITGIRVFQ
jgi:hypothetical protein